MSFGLFFSLDRFHPQAGCKLISNDLVVALELQAQRPLNGARLTRVIFTPGRETDCIGSLKLLHKRHACNHCIRIDQERVKLVVFSLEEYEQDYSVHIQRGKTHLGFGSRSHPKAAQVIF